MRERERQTEGERNRERERERGWRGKCPKIETNSRGEMEIQADLKGGVTGVKNNTIQIQAPKLFCKSNCRVIKKTHSLPL